MYWPTDPITEIQKYLGLGLKTSAFCWLLTFHSVDKALSIVSSYALSSSFLLNFLSAVYASDLLEFHCNVIILQGNILDTIDDRLLSQTESVPHCTSLLSIELSGKHSEEFFFGGGVVFGVGFLLHLVIFFKNFSFNKSNAFIWGGGWGDIIPVNMSRAALAINMKQKWLKQILLSS